MVDGGWWWWVVVEMGGDGGWWWLVVAGGGCLLRLLTAVASCAASLIVNGFALSKSAADAGFFFITEAWHSFFEDAPAGLFMVGRCRRWSGSATPETTPVVTLIRTDTMMIKAPREMLVLRQRGYGHTRSHPLACALVCSTVRQHRRVGLPTRLH